MREESCKIVLFIYQSKRRHNSGDRKFLGGPEIETAGVSKTLVQNSRSHISELLSVRFTKPEILHGQVCSHFFFICNGL